MLDPLPPTSPPNGVAPAPWPGHGAAPRPRLLVVDDQAVNIQALYHVFQADHQVLVATNGDQAIALCRDKQPDAVLLDILMPGMDGYEVCARLKGDAETRDIPVIFVTAETDEASETRGLDAGAVDFITKPINPRIVRARVRTHVTLKQQTDRLRQIALVDGLTGVANRRCFDEVLGREWRRAMRTGRPLSLLMLDVDHFKAFNDRYGHQAGDDCLRRVAMAIAGTLSRPGDLVARYGGEEFACILPETERTGAAAVARMLVERVRELHIPHAASSAGDWVTVSIGVAGTDGRGAASEAALLGLADTQLYRAKQAGRARVESELPTFS